MMTGDLPESGLDRGEFLIPFIAMLEASIEIELHLNAPRCLRILGGIGKENCFGRTAHVSCWPVGALAGIWAKVAQRNYRESYLIFGQLLLEEYF